MGNKCIALSITFMPSSVMAKNKLPAPIEFGQMPCRSVNLTLDMELEDGVLFMSGRSQIHISQRRPEQYTKLLPHIGRILSSPLYIGDDLKNPGKIEFIGRALSIGETILVAVDVVRDDKGRYHIATFYPVSEQKVTKRLGNGHLKIAK